MPKKPATTRGGTQRNKPKVQKGFELVRPTIEGETSEQQEPIQDAAVQVAEAVEEPAPQPTPQKQEKAALSPVQSISSATVPETPKGGSAAARLAARRQAAQSRQRRAESSLITPEHFAYVRKDMITIAILATVMFAAIIAMYFVFGAVL